MPKYNSRVLLGYVLDVNGVAGGESGVAQKVPAVSQDAAGPYLGLRYLVFHPLD